jgi:hypothetical protein
VTLEESGVRDRFAVEVAVPSPHSLWCSEEEKHRGAAAG